MILDIWKKSQVPSALYRLTETSLKLCGDLRGALWKNLPLLGNELGQRPHILEVQQLDPRAFDPAAAAPENSGGEAAPRPK